MREEASELTFRSCPLKISHVILLSATLAHSKDIFIVSTCLPRSAAVLFLRCVSSVVDSLACEQLKYEK